MDLNSRRKVLIAHRLWIFAVLLTMLFWQDLVSRMNLAHIRKVFIAHRALSDAATDQKTRIEASNNANVTLQQYMQLLALGASLITSQTEAESATPSSLEQESPPEEKEAYAQAE